MAAGMSQKATRIINAFGEDSEEEAPARDKRHAAEANPGRGKKRKGKEAASIDWEQEIYTTYDVDPKAFRVRPLQEMLTKKGKLRPETVADVREDNKACVFYGGSF